MGGCDLLSNSMIWEYASYAEPYIGFAGFLTCIMLSLLFFYAIYIDSVDELATFYYWMAGGAVVGFIFGWFLAHFVKVGAAILAGWGGFMLGLILNEAFLF